MKYRLNKLPVKTTNNFNINDILVDLDIPVFSMKSRFDISGKTDLLKIEEKLLKEKYSTRIGLELNNYYQIKIDVEKDVIIDEPIIINYNFGDEDVLFDKIIINYHDNSHCNFIIKYNSLDDSINFHHLLEEVNTDNNSSGNITLVNLLNNNSYQFMSVCANVSNYADLTHNIIDLDGNMRIYNFYSNVSDYGKNYLNTIYLGKNNDLLDFNYYLINNGISSLNNMKVEGVLDGRSSKNFRGTIDFLKGCSSAVGEEIENCVLLSDTARSRSLPQMLCCEDDVVGTHGVSSGKISNEKLFYLMSRGFSKKEAEKLIILSNYNRIINCIPDKDIQQEILDKIDSIIN